MVPHSAIAPELDVLVKWMSPAAMLITASIFCSENHEESYNTLQSKIFITVAIAFLEEQSNSLL